MATSHLLCATHCAAPLTPHLVPHLSSEGSLLVSHVTGEETEVPVEPSQGPTPVRGGLPYPSHPGLPAPKPLLVPSLQWGQQAQQRGGGCRAGAQLGLQGGRAGQQPRASGDRLCSELRLPETLRTSILCKARASSACWEARRSPLSPHLLPQPRTELRMCVRRSSYTFEGPRIAPARWLSLTRTIFLSRGPRSRQ